MLIFYVVRTCYYGLYLFGFVCAPLGSAIIYSSYVFPEKWVNSPFHKYYIPAATFNSVISTGLACYSR